jgi:hypothetical protein
MIRVILGLVVEGALGGVALRAALPGEQNWSIPQTLGYGLVAWVAVGIVLKLIFGAVAALLLPALILGGIYLYAAGRRGGRGRRR